MRLTNKMYVIHIDEAYKGDQYSYVQGVYATRKLAEKVFKDHIEDIKKTTNYDTVNEEKDKFEAYDEGWYSENHYTITLEAFDLKGEENA